MLCSCSAARMRSARHSSGCNRHIDELVQHLVSDLDRRGIRTGPASNAVIDGEAAEARRLVYRGSGFVLIIAREIPRRTRVRTPRRTE